MNRPSYMAQALAAAETAAALGEVPVGAVIVEAASGRVLAACGNRVESRPIPPPTPRCWRFALPAPRWGRPGCRGATFT